MCFSLPGNFKIVHEADFVQNGVDFIHYAWPWRLGRSCGALGRSWNALGLLLGRLEALLGRFWALLGRLGTLLGVSVALLGAPWAPPGEPWDASWVQKGRQREPPDTPKT